MVGVEDDVETVVGHPDAQRCSSTHSTTVDEHTDGFGVIILPVFLLHVLAVDFAGLHWLAAKPRSTTKNRVLTTEFDEFFGEFQENYCQLDPSSNRICRCLGSRRCCCLAEFDSIRHLEGKIMLVTTRRLPLDRISTDLGHRPATRIGIPWDKKECREEVPLLAVTEFIHMHIIRSSFGQSPDPGG